jgi:hypothetical protein
MNADTAKNEAIFFVFLKNRSTTFRLRLSGIIGVYLRPAVPSASSYPPLP